MGTNDKNRGCGKYTKSDKYTYSLRDTLPKSNPIIKALNSLRGQLSRCYNVKNLDYKYYGGKGIRVEYAKDEFVEWWLKECTSFSTVVKLTVDRIDSSKNYCFNNIRLIPWADNVSKSNLERSCRAVDVFEWAGNEIYLLETCKNVVEAAKKYRAGISLVHRHCNKQVRRSNVNRRATKTFRYHGA